MSADELELALPDGSTQVVPAEAVIRIDRAITRRLWMEGYLIGAGVGAFMLTVSELDETRGEDRPALLLAGPLLGGIWGGLIGLGAGGLMRAPVWEAVPRWGRSRTGARSGVTPVLLLDMRTQPDGNPSFRLGVKLRF